jgi:hypothetical protein
MVGFVFHRNSGKGGLKSEDVAESVRLIAQVLVGGIGKAVASRDRGLLQRQDCNLFRVGHRKRAEQKSVDDAKNRGIYSHPKGESHDSNRGKPRILCKSPQGKTDIFCEIAHR